MAQSNISLLALFPAAANTQRLKIGFFKHIMIFDFIS